ncbi:MAG: hypothetical protein WAT39_18765 [Planctomycetota bacterium]
MHKPILAVALSAVPVLAQANAVPGLDIRMYDVAGVSYYGRQGAAYPNGEAGFMVGHSWCNGGTVNLPWVSQSGGVMVDQYPRIAFLLARESGGRMVQISGQGHSKHSPTAFNFSSGPCAPCQSGGGGFFFVGCSDTYGAGTNASQIQLGPNTEINPWLGTWNPQGSYFDRGDPAVSGAAATDSVRSLTSSQVAAFGPVKNRMIVREPELLAGASYWAQVQAVVQGEPVGNRSNNQSSRPVSITGTGSGWTVATTGASVVGSVLTRWTGASTDVGGNGNDDGRFLVAVKVTGPVAGAWHYEYAVHNLDNSRAGATVRIPVDAAAVVTNAGFRDVDGDPLNDWTFARTATEIVFSAAANNALEWNTIYNCWFDCTVAPSFGIVSVDQARPGPGAPTVDVASEVPNGLPVATKQSIGTSCGTCTPVAYEYFGSAPLFDLANRAMTMTLNGGAYTLADVGAAFVAPAGTVLALTDDSEVAVTLPFALPYPGGSTTQLRVCSNGFISPAGSNGTSFTPTAAALLSGLPRWAAAWHDYNPATGGQVLFDSTPAEVRVTWNNVNNYSGGGAATFQYRFLPNGTVHVVWQAMNPAGNGYAVGWSPGGVAIDPGPTDLSVSLGSPMTLCASAFAGVQLDTSARPILGTTFQWLTTGIPAGTPFGALLLSTQQAVPPIDLTAVGMTGCMAHLVAPIAWVYVAPGSSVQQSQSVPNNPGLIGAIEVGQAITYSPPLTPLGFVLSNGMLLTLGL